MRVVVGNWASTEFHLEDGRPTAYGAMVAPLKMAQARAETLARRTNMRPSERVMEISEKLKHVVRLEYIHALHYGGEMDRKGLLLLAGGSQEALRLAEKAVLAEAGLDGFLDVSTDSTTD